MQEARLRWLRLRLCWDGQRLWAPGFDRAAEEAAASLTNQRSPACDVLRVMEEQLQAGLDFAAVVEAAEGRTPKEPERTGERQVAVVARYHQMVGNDGRGWQLAVPEAPGWLLEWVAWHGGKESQIAAMHTALPVETMRALCGRASAYTLCGLARNERAPRDVLEVLLKEDALVRFTLIDRSPLEEWLAERLAKDPDPGVRAQLAKHERPSWVFRLLVNDPDPRVRAMLAANWFAMPAVAEQLSKDPDHNVAYNLSTNYGALSEEQRMRLATHPCEPARQSVARQSVSTLIRRRLEKDPSAMVRQVLASSEWLTPGTARALLSDPAVIVRMQLAANRATPDAVLRELAGDRIRRVRGAALKALELRAGERGL